MAELLPRLSSDTDPDPTPEALTTGATLFITNPDQESSASETQHDLHETSEAIARAITRPRNASQSSTISNRLQLSSEHVLTLTPGSILTVAPASDSLETINEADLEWQSTAEERLCLANHAGDVVVSRNSSLFLHGDLHVRGSLFVEGEISAQNDADISIDGNFFVSSAANANFERGGRVKIGGYVKVPVDASMKVRNRDSLVLLQRKPGVFVSDEGVVRRGSQMRRRERLSLSTAMHMRMLRQWASDSLESSHGHWTGRARLQSQVRAMSDMTSETRSHRPRPATRSVTALGDMLTTRYQSTLARPVQSPNIRDLVQGINRRPTGSSVRHSVYDEIAPEYPAESDAQAPPPNTEAPEPTSTPQRTPSTRSLAPPSYIAAVRASSAGIPHSLNGTRERPPPYTHT